MGAGPIGAARDPEPAREPRSGRCGTRRIVGSFGNRTLTACRRVDQSSAGHHGLPCRGPGAAQSERAGNECAAARNGAHRASGSVQPRPPDLGAAVARGSRPAVHARALMAAAATDPPPQRRFALLLMGPTGAGKSELAIQLASRLPFEIISVDSAQVYRGMDIGTAKPDPQTRRSIAHHLIDIRDPVMSYSAGEFVRDASQAMLEIWQRGRQPLLVGGTMLYFHALKQGLADLPEADLAVRAQIDAQAATAGWAAVHGELERVDPAAAARIHVNDPQRIQRALEVYRVTGEPITRLQQTRRSAFAGVDVLEVAVAPFDRAALHRRIEARFRHMLAAGFLDEVSALRK